MNEETTATTDETPKPKKRTTSTRAKKAPAKAKNEAPPAEKPPTLVLPPHPEEPESTPEPKPKTRAKKQTPAPEEPSAPEEPPVREQTPVEAQAPDQEQAPPKEPTQSAERPQRSREQRSSNRSRNSRRSKRPDQDNRSSTSENLDASTPATAPDTSAEQPASTSRGLERLKASMKAAKEASVFASHQDDRSDSSNDDYGDDSRDERDPRDDHHDDRDERNDQPREEPQKFDLKPAEGVLEISGKGFGFIREAKRAFMQTPRDVFVRPEIVRRYGLRDGMWIGGVSRRGNRGPQLDTLETINGEDPAKYESIPWFDELTVINPMEQIILETEPTVFTTRVIDLMAPIGKGQRGLIVAPPRVGKTTLLEHIAAAVAKNHPDMKLMILLVDERPEEVTEISRSCPNAEVMASSNDSDVKSHTKIAQIAIDRAKRLVEAGHDVFLLMDSLTRLGRAFNNASSGSGRTLSGGMDAKGMEIPRRLFAAARNTEEAGSLTIVATALVDTGSRMDELIFQEFKGTGNMELVLDRKISDMRVYPAVDIFLSGTRREELLISADKLEKISVIRRGLSGHKPIEAIERLLSFLHKFPTNQQMLDEIPLG